MNNTIQSSTSIAHTAPLKVNISKTPLLCPPIASLISRSKIVWFLGSFSFCRLFFLVVDDGSTRPTHHLPTDLMAASVLMLACRMGCRVIVDKSASSLLRSRITNSSHMKVEVAMEHRTYKHNKPYSQNTKNSPITSFRAQKP